MKENEDEKIRMLEKRVEQLETHAEQLERQIQNLIKKTDIKAITNQVNREQGRQLGSLL
jgi:hypothetical protein